MSMESIYSVYIVTDSRTDKDTYGKDITTRMVITSLVSLTLDHDYYFTYKEIRKKFLCFSYWTKHITNSERVETFQTAPRAIQDCIDKGYKLIKK